MLDFQVRRMTTRAGAEVAVLLDRARGPLGWPNAYAASEFARRGRSVETSIKALRSIGMARMWLASRGRDLDYELRRGGFLSSSDVDGLAEALACDAASLLSKCGAHPSRPGKRVARLEDARPDHRLLARQEIGTAPNAEVASRIWSVARYMEWHLLARVGTLDRRRQDGGALGDHGKDIIKRLRELAPDVPRDHGDDETLEGVPKEVLERIETALDPASETNPFRSPFVRARNYLIWRLLVDTGARRGEVRHAKVADIEYAIRRFHIRVSKTQPRTMPISRDVADAFDEFLQEHWSKLPLGARKREYLFTDENGRHLSTRAFNRLFERVREKVEGVPPFMAPHVARRNWNDNLSAKVDALPASQRPRADEIRIRNGLQGWSRRSEQGGRYSRRHVRESADGIAEAMANELHGSGEDR